MAEIKSFDPSSNVEDRREEFSPIQHLLMELGLFPPGIGDGNEGRKPGHFDPRPYIADNPIPLDLNPMPLQAGLLDIKLEPRDQIKDKIEDSAFDPTPTSAKKMRKP